MEKENIFLCRRIKTEMEKEENIWRGKIYFLWKTSKMKSRKIFGKGKIFICRGEENGEE